jgi:PEP-CTERM motif
VIKTARDAFGITGGNSGVNGYVSISFVAVPEPSTWVMMLAGFGALGGMLLRRGRKAITPT